jgi:hypothetical protein
MYKIIKDVVSGNDYCILKMDSNLIIPFNPDNTDYQAYLKWVAEGNTPEPAEGAE